MKICDRTQYDKCYADASISVGKGFGRQEKLKLPLQVLDYRLVDNDGLGYGLDRSMNLWFHGRDILHDIFGHNSLHEEFGIYFCNEILEFIHQYGEIGIDVISTGGNNGFWFGAILGSTREIKLEKNLILEDLKSFVGSVVEEDSSGV
ncbi:hypothetical protein Tco_1484519 [Tanacetum coccineum]